MASQSCFENELVCRDSNGKIRVVYIRGVWFSTSSEFKINKETGLLGGKLILQPEKVIDKGKAKRTPYEQGILEYKSQIKKYTDKGYKDIKEFTKKKLNSLTESEINEFLPNIKTDANNIPKPMLAKPYKDVATKAFDKEYYASRKLDGVRCLLYRKDDEDGTWSVHSASRGGQDYDLAIRHILTDPAILKIFEMYPYMILDGEIYVHGWTLQRISGTVRLEKITKETLERTHQLQYWIYDIADDSKTFDKRFDMLLDLQPIIESSSVLHFVEHIPISGWLRIQNLHDKYVKEGFEGVVIRRLDAPYGYGKRTAAMIKVKQYTDDEFIIVGWEKGLRPVEDMVFVLQTKHGKLFKAKPMGEVSVKYEYVNNMENIIGKKGTVSYFAMSEDGIPMQPTFKHVREEGE